MNKVIPITLLCALAFTANSAMAQRRGANNAGRKVPTTALKMLCEGDAIPKGYVIVGYNASAKCGDKSQLVIKQPDDAEIVCKGSPIPVVVQFGLFSVLPRRALRLGGRIGVKVSTAETPRARRFAES